MHIKEQQGEVSQTNATFVKTNRDCIYDDYPQQYRNTKLFPSIKNPMGVGGIFFYIKPTRNNKEDVYKNASRKMVISVLEEYLRLSAYYGHKRFFDKIKKTILKKYGQNLSVIGWNNFAKRHLLGNYIYCRLYLRNPFIGRLYWFLKQQVVC